MKGIITITLILTALLLVVDAYTFKGLKMLMKNIDSQLIKRIFTWVYWAISIGMVLLLFFSIGYFNSALESHSYKVPFTVASIFMIYLSPKLFFIVFHLIEDISFIGYWGVKKVIESSETTEIYSRSEFLVQSISKLGIGIAGLQFGAMIYGATKGRFNYDIVHQPIEFDNLPDSFNGVKIVQLSDLHVGSFFDNHKEIEKAINKVNELNPDYILFTGDMVNNYAWELDGWEEIIGKLKAKHGKFSILGNHDYADYVQWDNEADKAKNLASLKQRQAKMGFRLLLNESVKLERNGEFIELLGLENWGKGRFAKYGDLVKTMKNSVTNSFKILMSHDPSHWDEQVLEKTDINLALAGHTHGMQYGVKIGSFQFSPVQFRYPRWAGLYTENKQHLYVNRGFGYIGFAGRVGISPEITLLELRQKV
ncbi:MAG: metallophosphoesterase [Flavobacteriales bacterium]|nr:metallophosphoesterase [Flavobacteriales bacterium]